MAADGITRAIAFATSAYSSYSSCRQYLEDIDRARAVVGETAPRIRKIRPYFLHAGFIASCTAGAARAVASLPEAVRARPDLVFTAHSIPQSMAAASGPAGGAYQAQLAEVASLVAAGLGISTWRLAYQSRSGPPAVPWLEPDISECLKDLARAGSQAVVIVPIGFVSDHMEVIFDLDIEAAQAARDLGLPMARAATAGTDPHFVAMISSLAAAFESGRPAAVPGFAASLCAAGCCARGSQSASRPGARLGKGT